MEWDYGWYGGTGLRISRQATDEWAGILKCEQQRNQNKQSAQHTEMEIKKRKARWSQSEPMGLQMRSKPECYRNVLSLGS